MYQCKLCGLEKKFQRILFLHMRRHSEEIDKIVSAKEHGTMMENTSENDIDSNENFSNWEDMETDFGVDRNEKDINNISIDRNENDINNISIDRNENDITNISNNCPNLEKRTNLQPIIKLTPIKLPKRMLAKNVKIEETHNQENANLNFPNSAIQNQIKIETNEHSAEIIPKIDSSDYEVDFCLEASKFIMNQTCLICDCEFESMAVVLNHIENLHLSIILKPTVNSNHEKIGNMKEEDFKIDIEENFIETSWENNFTKSLGHFETIKAENIDYTSPATTEPTGAGVNTFSAILKTPTKEVSISESDLTNENTNIGKKEAQF